MFISLLQTTLWVMDLNGGNQERLWFGLLTLPIMMGERAAWISPE